VPALLSLALLVGEVEGADNLRFGRLGLRSDQYLAITHTAWTMPGM
jgi:hypothetical protein